MTEFRVIITRTADAAGALIAELTSGFALAGYRLNITCTPVQVAAFDPACLDNRQLTKLLAGDYDWVTFTSANGVRGLARALGRGGLVIPDKALPGEKNWLAQVLSQSKIACVGRATAAQLAAHGISADFIPETQDAAHMVRDWPQAGQGEEVLCIQGANARATLAEGLAQHSRVETLTVYRMDSYPSSAALTPATTEQPQAPEKALAAVLPELKNADAVIATAPSLLTELVREFRAAGGQGFPPVIAIGRSTAARAEELGLSYRVSPHPQPAFLAETTLCLARELDDNKTSNQI